MDERNNTPKRRGLGRGLDALFQDSKREEESFAPKIRRADEIVSAAVSQAAVPERQAPRAPNLSASAPAAVVQKETVPNAAPVASPAPSASGLRKIAIEKLTPGKFQPRRRFEDEAIDNLAESIRVHGVLQPLLVRPALNAGEFEIIAGERRWRASQKAQLHELPVVVVEFDDRQTLEVALIENLQREDLSPMEEAEGYQRLMEEFGHSQEDLGKSLGKSRSHVANTLRLLKLPEAVKRVVDEGALSAGHARALVGCANAADIAKTIVKRGLSVRQTEKLVKLAAEGKPVRAAGKSAPKVVRKDVDVLALEEKVSSALGLKVTIEGEGSKGKLVIEYTDLEQLDDVLERLSHSPRRG